jgi:membrane-bound lytic murein transglycosylase D
VKELESLNPELRTGRAPPAPDAPPEAKLTVEDALYTIVVPSGKSTIVKDAGPKLAPKGNALEKHVVRFGESLDQIAAARKITKAKLIELNGITKDEAVRGGTVLLVPQVAGITASPGAGTAFVGSGEVASNSKPIALVPGISFAYADRQRVFYRVLVGDTLREIADAFAVTVDDLKKWNAIEPTARLHEGMTLQLFVPKSADLSRVVFHKEGEMKILAVGSDEFYDYEEAQRGRKRTTVQSAGGETLEQLGKKHGMSAGMMEKINRRPRSDLLAKGESVIVYVPISKTIAPAPTAAIVADGDLPAVEIEPVSDGKKASAAPAL